MLLLESLQAVQLLHYHVHSPQRFLPEPPEHLADVLYIKLVVDRLRLLFCFALDDLMVALFARKIQPKVLGLRPLVLLLFTSTKYRITITTVRLKEMRL